jgi:class 3 adenylate cyclase
MGSATDSRAPDARFTEQALVLVLADLAGFTRAVGHLPAVEIAAVVDRFYTVCGPLVAEHGGRVIKFTGDNCLAVFEPANAPNAVRFVLALRDAVGVMADELGLDIDLGANVHLATVATGTFGTAPAVDDIMGIGVVYVHRMGSGVGIRISEPVYRKLPSSERGPWHKHQPPATYTFAS